MEKLQKASQLYWRGRKGDFFRAFRRHRTIITLAFRSFSGHQTHPQADFSSLLCWSLMWREKRTCGVNSLSHLPENNIPFWSCHACIRSFQECEISLSHRYFKKTSQQSFSIQRTLVLRLWTAASFALTETSLERWKRVITSLPSSIHCCSLIPITLVPFACMTHFFFRYQSVLPPQSPSKIERVKGWENVLPRIWQLSFT